MNFAKRALDGIRDRRAEFLANEEKRAREREQRQQPAKKSARLSEFAVFMATVQPGEGYVFGDFVAAGHRKLKVSHFLRGGSHAVSINGSMPRDDEKLSPALYNYKARFAVDGNLQDRIQDVSIWGNEIGVDIRNGRPDRVPYKLYAMTARCLFELDPDLAAVRLGANRWKEAEAAQLDGRVIMRSDLPPLEGPALTM